MVARRGQFEYVGSEASSRCAGIFATTRVRFGAVTLMARGPRAGDELVYSGDRSHLARSEGRWPGRSHIVSDSDVTSVTATGEYLWNRLI